MCQTLSWILRDSVGTSAIIGRGRKTDENVGVNKYTKGLQEEPLTQPRSYQGRLPGGGVPELVPGVGIVLVERKHVLWDSLSGSTLLNLDFKAESRES